MTEEEKKAIERCKELIKTEHSSWIGITNQLAIETVIKKYENQQSELEKKEKMIDLIKEEVRDHIGFENRLKRDKREPDMFNQGRFYVTNNINKILKGK